MRNRPQLTTMILLAISALLAWLPAQDATGQSPQAQLTGDWKLVKLGDAEAPKGEPITLSVAADGKVSGSTGVNRYFGALGQGE